MRSSRLVGALVALVLAVTGLALAAPSDAQAGKPKHDLTATGKEIGHTDKFIAYGRVATYPKGKIKVLRSVAAGKYKTWKKIKTSETGRFRTRIYQVGTKRTCFKIQVPETDVYRKTTSGNIGCIFSV